MTRVAGKRTHGALSGSILGPIVGVLAMVMSSAHGSIFVGEEDSVRSRLSLAAQYVRAAGHIGGSAVER